MGDYRAKDADVTGAGDLDHIGREFPDQRRNFQVVPKEKQIKTMGTIERKGHGAALKLNSGDRPFGKSLSARADMNHQKGQTVFASIRLKVTAGLSHAVNFAVVIREVRNPGLFRLQRAASREVFEEIRKSTLEGSERLRERRVAEDSHMRSPAKIRLRKSGGVFQRAERGRIAIPSRPGWNTRSSQRREPSGASG